MHSVANKNYFNMGSRIKGKENLKETNLLHISKQYDGTVSLDKGDCFTRCHTLMHC
jgi:hypothetical protein